MHNLGSLARLSLSLLLLLLAAYALPASAQINYDFCTLSATDTSTGDGSSETDPQVWSAAQVQGFASILLADPAIADTPWIGYPLAYKALTHERDVQRCGGSLGSDDRSQRLIGDLLADLMSRWLMKETAACAAGASFSDHTSGICAAMARSKSQNYDALRTTMEMTAVYLSSHMGMALVAVVYDDAFWNQEYPEATHCAPGSSPCGGDVLQARLAVMQTYKQLYDKNNAFLAVNINRVLQTLKDGCLIRGDIIQAGGYLASALGGLDTALFAQIRNATFAAAMTTAASFDPSSHPMLAYENGLYVAQYREFATFTQMPAPLAEAEAKARGILASPAISWSFTLLGSQSWSQLAQQKPSLESQCSEAQEAASL